MSEKECMQAFSLVIRSPLCRRLNLSLHDFWADESIFEKERTRKSSGPLFGRLNRWFSASKSATFCWLPFAESQRRTQCITQHGPSLFYGLSFLGFWFIASTSSPSIDPEGCYCLFSSSSSEFVCPPMVVSIFNCILILINRPCNRRCPSQEDDDADNANDKD